MRLPKIPAQTFIYELHKKCPVSNILSRYMIIKKNNLTKLNSAIWILYEWNFSSFNTLRIVLKLTSQTEC